MVEDPVAWPGDGGDGGWEEPSEDGRTAFDAEFVV